MEERQLDPATGPVPVLLSHLAMKTRHLAEVVDWYGTVLGTRPNFQNEGGASLTYDGEHHRFAMVDVTKMPLAGSFAEPGLEHVAFKVESLSALLSNYLRLKNLGVTPAYCLNHHATISIYYLDPDGVHIEFFIDAFVPDIANEHMTHGGQLEANPIGNPFDPDDLVARFRAGEPMAGLLKAPEFKPELLSDFMQSHGIEMPMAPAGAS